LWVTVTVFVAVFVPSGDVVTATCLWTLVVPCAPFVVVVFVALVFVVPFAVVVLCTATCECRTDACVALGDPPRPNSIEPAPTNTTKIAPNAATILIGGLRLKLTFIPRRRRR